MQIPELTSSDRAFLRKEAHHRHPLVAIGAKGMTEAVQKALDEALAAHELVKVKFHDHVEERRGLADELAQACGAALVTVIGHTAIFWRPAKDPDLQMITLPSRKRPHA